MKKQFLIFGLFLFAMACTKEKESENKGLTAAALIGQAEKGEMVIININEISPSEKMKLREKADQVFNLKSEEALEAYKAFSNGELELLNTSPIGEKGQHFDWGNYERYREHAKLFELLKSKGLIKQVEEQLPAGTWLNEGTVSKIFPEIKKEEMNSFFFQHLNKKLINQESSSINRGCGTETCTYSDCGNCHLSMIHYNGQVILDAYKHHYKHCIDECGCSGSSTSVRRC